MLVQALQALAAAPKRRGALPAAPSGDEWGEWESTGSPAVRASRRRRDSSRVGWGGTLRPHAVSSMDATQMCLCVEGFGLGTEGR
jgi:hypothetical protein